MYIYIYIYIYKKSKILDVCTPRNAYGQCIMKLNNKEKLVQLRILKSTVLYK